MSTELNSISSRISVRAASEELKLSLPEFLKRCLVNEIPLLGSFQINWTPERFDEDAFITKVEGIIDFESLASSLDNKSTTVTIKGRTEPPYALESERESDLWYSSPDSLKSEKVHLESLYLYRISIESLSDKKITKVRKQKKSVSTTAQILKFAAKQDEFKNAKSERARSQWIRETWPSLVEDSGFNITPMPRCPVDSTVRKALKKLSK